MRSLWSALPSLYLLISHITLFLATLSDQTIGIIIIADYLLYWLNRHKNFSYVHFLHLDKPSDDITEVLVKGAVGLNYILDSKNYVSGMSSYGHNFKQIHTLIAFLGEMMKSPDLETTANMFVSAFRKGELGRVMLDDDIIT